MDVNDDNSTDVLKTRSTEGSVPSNSSVLSLISVDRPLPTEPRAQQGCVSRKMKMSHQPKKYVPFAVTMITVISPVTGTQSMWPGTVHALL